MRRTSAISIIVLVLGATVGVGAPARAGGLNDCFHTTEPPPLKSVTYVPPLTIIIDEDAAVSDVLAAAGWVLQETVGRALCLENGIVTSKVPCLQAKAGEIVASIDVERQNLRYVRRDPETGETVIDGNLLLADATACL